MSIDYKGHNKDRLRRARSWLKRASEENCSDEEAFLFYWIAFNAAYGQLPDDKTKETKERRLFKAFADKIIAHDSQNNIKKYLTDKSSAVKTLIENQYIYELFWKFTRGQETGYWEKKFSNDNKDIWDKWGRGNVSGMLNEMLSRLYTLRNQIIHGGITFGGDGWGKAQLKSGHGMMRLLVPPIIEIMAKTIADKPDTDEWGAVAYPRYKEHEPD